MVLRVVGRTDRQMILQHRRTLGTMVTLSSFAKSGPICPVAAGKVAGHPQLPESPHFACCHGEGQT